MKVTDQNQDLEEGECRYGERKRISQEVDIDSSARERLLTDGQSQESDMAEEIEAGVRDNTTNIFDKLAASHKEMDPDIELDAEKDRCSGDDDSFKPILQNYPKIHDTKIFDRSQGSSYEEEINTSTDDHCCTGIEPGLKKESSQKDDDDICPQNHDGKGTVESDHCPRIHDPNNNIGYDEVDQYPRIHNPNAVDPFKHRRTGSGISRYDDNPENIFNRGTSSVSDLRKSKRSNIFRQSSRSCSNLFPSHSGSQRSVSEISKNEDNDIGPGEFLNPENSSSESPANSSADVDFYLEKEPAICPGNQYPTCADISPEEMDHLNQLDNVDNGKKVLLPCDGTSSELVTSSDYRVSLFSMFMYLAGPVLYLLDIGSDIYLALEYYSGGDKWWFVLTMAFIIVPAITMNIFSLMYYIFTSRKKEISFIWVTRGLFHILLLGPLLRMFQTIHYACFTRKCCLNKEKWNKLTEEEQEKRLCEFKSKMAAHAANSDFIRLFETYMEAMPQLILQLYVMTLLGTGTNLSLFLKQCFSLLTSWMAVSVAQPGSQKSTRFAEHPNDDTKNISMVGLVLNALSTAIVIAARALSMAMFASIHKWTLLILAGFHWFGMFVWSILQKTTFCKTFDDDKKPRRCLFGFLELCYNAATAFIMLFSFISLTPGDTLIKRLAFYTLTYFENIILVAMWYHGSDNTLWYHVPIIIYVIVSFLPFTGLVALYYCKYHPIPSKKTEDQNYVI